MAQMVQGLFGGGGASRQMRESQEQAAVAAARQQSLAQEQAAQTDLAAGRAIKVPRGRKVLLAGGDEQGLPSKTTVG